MDEKRQEKILFQSTRPGCTCRADTRVRGDVTDTSTFTPVKLGNYQVRAYFDQIEKTVNFTVESRLGRETTTTTTIPSAEDLDDYLRLEGHNLQKCRNTVVGSMNTVNVDIGDEITGVWMPNPNSYILYSCDGEEKVPVDKVLLKGGSNIGKNQSLTGSYRLMVRCGRNTLMDDLTKCNKLEIYLDTEGVIVFEQPKEEVEETTTSTTTITLSVLETSTTMEGIPSTTVGVQKDSVK